MGDRWIIPTWLTVVFFLVAGGLAILRHAQDAGWSAAADPTACDQYQPQRQKVWHAKP